MILLDPDLDPDPAPPSRATKRTSAAKFPNLRLPAKRTLERFLSEAESAVKLRGEVTVFLTTDDVLRDLNHRFRGKNKPTDVLSFPSDKTAPRAEKIAGDLAISVPTARRQAVEQGHPLRTEIKVLMLHGLLHLAGNDHESDTGQMERRERVLRTRLRLPGGLIERTVKREPQAPLRPHAGKKRRALTAAQKERRP